MPTTFEIGRAVGGDGALGGDSQLSREHARIARSDDGSVLLEDLGSANGTFLNGERVTGPQPLNPGDRIVVGTSVLEAVVSVRQRAPTALDHHGLIEYEEPASRESPPTVERVLPGSKSPSRLALLVVLGLLVVAAVVVIALLVAR